MNIKKIVGMTLLVTLTACVHLIASARAYAQVDLIAQMDQDEDGLISIREAVADPNLLAAFGKIDTDGDGKISQAELDTAMRNLQIKNKS